MTFPEPSFGNLQVMITAINCYNSKEYQDAWSLAKETTFRDLEIVEGV
jgi:uncharacterized protein (DUF1330 family)